MPEARARAKLKQTIGKGRRKKMMAVQRAPVTLARAHKLMWVKSLSLFLNAR